MSQFEISTQKIFTAALETAAGKGPQTEQQLRAALQAFIENKPAGESSLDDKIVAKYEHIWFTETNFRETIQVGWQKMRRHRNGGGWVPVEQDERDLTKPFVAETAYVGPHAMVVGNARVTDWAHITGHTQVSASARVSEKARISDNAQVYGDAWVSGNAIITGNAWVYGHARLFGTVIVFENARVCGNAVIGEGEVRGDTCVPGTVQVG